MTIQVVSPEQGKSKGALAAALNADAASVWFENPSIFAGRDSVFPPGRFQASLIRRPISFPVVRDHPRRSRFAEVSRDTKGVWRVK